MCGIVGILNKNNQAIESGLLTRMRDVMLSRGPDDAGIWMEGPVGFGHRRLSIIDLSSLGRQPMVDEETGAVIVYNGEVYNYQEIREELKKYGIKFMSQTDTEVVLKAYRKWGRTCVNKFIGMFSFAIWDQKLRGIFLARDRMGIKPLYYYASDKVFLFASRLGALLQNPLCPREIDPSSLSLYLNMGFVPSPRSILAGVKKLRPGHTLWVDGKSINENCYWSLDSIKIDPLKIKKPEDELVEELDYLLRSSVKMRLISDVPLGSFLSGGIDSSLVTALMCQYKSNLPKTFTIGFDDQEYDESLYARKIAQYLGTSHHERIMRSQDLLSLLNTNRLSFDEPFADSSSLPTMLVSRFAREQVTVCLSGDGGDELFGGYHCYLIPFYLRYAYYLPQNLRSLIGKIISGAASQKYKIVGEALVKEDLISSFDFLRGITGSHPLQSLFDRDALDSASLYRERLKSIPEMDEISKFCRIDAAYYLTDDSLQKLDVASMAVSLEARVPVLDHRVVEFSLSLPLKYKIGVGENKRLLKKVLNKYIPAQYFRRPKRGFSTPMHKWLRTELKEMLCDELSSSRVKKFWPLDPRAIENLIAQHLSGQQNNAQLLWALLCLFRWKNSFLEPSLSK